MSDERPPNDVYLEAHLVEALARDPRVGELGLEVVVSGNVVIVRGAVSTHDRCEAVDEVLRTLAPDREIRNHTTCNPVSDHAGEPEVIS